MIKTEVFKAITEQTTDGVFITDKQGIIEYANPAFLKLTGFSKKEILGNKPNIIKSGLHKPSYYKKLWSTITAGKTFRGIVINKKKNGDLFYTDHSITPIKNNKGEILRYVGTWKDVSTRALNDQKKDDFISSIGHELKTPLTVLKLLTNILAKNIKENNRTKTRESLNKIDAQIDKITNLLNDLLDISRIRLGKFEMNLEYFSLNSLIEEIRSNISEINPDRKIIFINSPVKSMVLADKNRIGQVLINLVNNAIKYSKKEIEIKIETDDKHVKVMVKDWGVGIEKKYQQKIFDRYFSITGSTGLGMGLYICSQIIKKHRGKIWVESKIGKGSTFMFSLPIRPN